MSDNASAQAANPGFARRTPALGTLPTPFVWQHNDQVLLLDEELDGWTVAELHFDARRCHYVELRRATYRWPREAAGALLSRALRCHNADETHLGQAAENLGRWLERRSQRLEARG